MFDRQPRPKNKPLRTRAVLNPEKGLAFQLQIEALLFIDLELKAELPAAIDEHLESICEIVADPKCLHDGFVGPKMANKYRTVFATAYTLAPAVFIKIMARLENVRSRISPILQVLRRKEIIYQQDGRWITRKINDALDKEIVSCLEDEFPGKKWRETAVARCRERLAELDDPSRASKTLKLLVARREKAAEARRRKRK